MKTRSRVFGFQPRIALRRDFCSATSLCDDEPEVNEMMAMVGRHIEKVYKQHFGKTVEKQYQILKDKVLPEWQIEGTPFTSGIINLNNPLPYHFDAGNFKDVCSCMIAFKGSTAGGYLSMPEFNLALEISDHSLSIFDGQKILHGVTPIKKLKNDAYRITAVYYTLKGMWNCEPLTDELARIRNVKTKRENTRAGVDSEVYIDNNGIVTNE